MSGYLQSDKYKAIVLTVKLTGLLSIIGSGMIIRDILTPKKNINGKRLDAKMKLKSMPRRILLIMSICDIIYGFIAWIMGSWMVPSSTKAFWAAGNQASCRAQGFLQLWFYGSATLLNASLSITYVLSIQFGWKEKDFLRLVPQFFLLVFPVLFFLALSTWGIVEDLYKFNFGPTCGVPASIKEYKIIGMVYQLSTFMIISLSMLVLWLKVLGVEKVNDKYQFRGLYERNQSNRVAKEGSLYAGSFFLTYVPFFTIYIMSLRGIKADWWMVYVTFFLLPLQGFWNAIVYFRKKRKQVSRNTLLNSSVSKIRKYANNIATRMSTTSSRPQTARVSYSSNEITEKNSSGRETSRRSYGSNEDTEKPDDLEVAASSEGYL